MMRQKVIIGSAVLLLILIMVLMARDMFHQKEVGKTNPWAYELEDFKKIDTSLFGYSETHRFVPIIQRLRGIAIDAEDNIYLTGLQKVMVYNANYEFQKGFKIQEEAKNIAIAANGDIYLGISDHVEVWSNDGELLQSWDAYNNRSVITSIALQEASVFVADAGNKVVLEYDVSGHLMQEIGRKDTANGIPGFIIPSPFFDLAIGRQGELWAVNSGLHAFEAYNSEGRLISSWESTSMQLDGFSGCCNPSHIALLADGAFVTSEKGLVRVKIHEPSGDFRCVVAGPDEFDEGTKGLDLAVNSAGDIFLIVPDKNEVRVYKKHKN